MNQRFEVSAAQNNVLSLVLFTRRIKIIWEIHVFRCEEKVAHNSHLTAVISEKYLID